jgi:hypothetical protein
MGSTVLTRTADQERRQCVMEANSRMHESKRLPLVGVLCCLLLNACAFNRTPDQVEDLISQAFRAAEKHHEFQMDAEAALLMDAISAVDQDYPGLRDLTDDLDPGALEGMQRSMLGMNRTFRPQVERSAHTRALLWIPDRLLDLLDVVTVGVHLGTGAFADAHVTRAVQVGAGFRTTGGLGVHDHRSIGMKSQAEAGLTVIAIGAHSYAGALIGTSGTRGSADSSKGIHRPSAPLYQQFRDYWALGANATAGIVGVEVDFHPLQLADFLAGIIGFDFLNDDLAHTRGLKLDAVENKLLVDLWKVRSSRPTLAAYQEEKRFKGSSGGEGERAQESTSKGPRSGPLLSAD